MHRILPNCTQIGKIQALLGGLCRCTLACLSAWWLSHAVLRCSSGSAAEACETHQLVNMAGISRWTLPSRKLSMSQNLPAGGMHSGARHLRRARLARCLACGLLTAALDTSSTRHCWSDVSSCRGDAATLQHCSWGWHSTVAMQRGAAHRQSPPEVSWPRSCPPGLGTCSTRPCSAAEQACKPGTW